MTENGIKIILVSKSSQKRNGDIYVSNTVLLHVSFSCSTSFSLLTKWKCPIIFLCQLFILRVLRHILLSLVDV